MSANNLEQVFERVQAMEPEMRDDFVHQVSKQNPALAEQLRGVLAHQKKAVEYFSKLDHDIATAAPLELETAVIPTVRIGPYQTTGVIGNGGMGVVYRAIRVDGEYEQEVALKFIHLDMETPAIRARFLAERQILAQLSHPNVARLQDGGVSDEGRPYFVMELVEGQAINQYCREQNCSLKTTIRLFLQVINAVSHLHQNLVVHRDLKPSNILVTAQGQVKLVDFGIAKLIEESGSTQLSSTTQITLTPEYAAPEQHAGGTVTTATDVYSLGVVLYELITGSRPFKRDRATGSAATFWPIDTPSSRLHEQAATTRYTRRIHGDLDNICLMALRPEPSLRYASAEQFGQDLVRFLADQTVLASGQASAYRLRKFIQRNRAILSFATVMCALAILGFLRERELRREADIARQLAHEEARKANTVADWLAEVLSSANPAQAQGRDVSVKEVLNLAAQRLDNEKDLVDQPVVEAALRLAVGNTYRSLGTYDQARLQLRRALTLHEKLNPTSVEVADILEALALTEHADWKNTESERLLRQVIELRQQQLGRDHLSTLAAMHHLANSLWRQGRFDEVEQVDQQVLEGRIRTLGEAHPDTLRSRMGRATTLFSRGHYLEAKNEYEQVLGPLRQQLGEHHPDVLKLMHNLATTYNENGQFELAEKMGREVLAKRIKAIGEKREATAMSMQNLAVYLTELGQFQEAETILQRSVEIRKSLGNSAVGEYFAQARLADVYRGQRRFEKAKALYGAALKGQENAASIGPDAPDSLQTRVAMARLQLDQGQAAEVIGAFRSLIERQKQALSPRHAEVLKTELLLAKALLENGQADEAIPVLDGILMERGKNLSAQHPTFRNAASIRAHSLALPVATQQPHE